MRVKVCEIVSKGIKKTRRILLCLRKRDSMLEANLRVHNNRINIHLVTRIYLSPYFLRLRSCFASAFREIG